MRDCIYAYSKFIIPCLKKASFSPTLGSIVGCITTLHTLMIDSMSIQALYSLGNTLHGRVGDRTYIYAGLEPKP